MKINLILFNVLVVLILQNVSVDGFEIAKNNKSSCILVLNNDASEPEKKAAEELKKVLQEITSSQFLITNSLPLDQTPAIIIGQGEISKMLFPGIMWETLGSEEIIIQTKKHYLLIAGGRPRGTLYSVSHFLQAYCGIRWWTPWATTIPKKATLYVNNINIQKNPAFEYREPFWTPAFNREWAWHNFCNGQSHRLDDASGGCIKYKGFVHTFYSLVPPEKYFNEHPEWFSMKNGQRTYKNAQLCLSNKELRDFVVAQVKQWIKESPDSTIVSVSQNDWFGACECPQCKAFADKEGSQSGILIDFVNYIAEKIEAEHPSILIDTLAYQYTRKPPRTIRPRHNVIVRLCSIECNFSEPLFQRSNNSFANDIREWSKICNRLYIWDYTTDFQCYVQPHPNYYVLGPNIRFFRDHNVKGVFEQGAYQSHGAEMAELRAWLLAQLLWDPNQDDKKLIKEFLDGYYGTKASKFLQQYLNLMSDAASGFYMTCFASDNAPYLQFNIIRESEILLQKAELAVANDAEKLWRVRQAHLPVYTIWLKKWNAFQQECFKSQKTWPLSTSRKAVAQIWLDLATNSGPQGWQPMTHVNESGLTPIDFIKPFMSDPPFFANRKSSVPRSNPLSHINPRIKKSCIILQDTEATLTKEGEWIQIVFDAEASDQLAAQMPGTHTQWAFQVPGSKMPKAAAEKEWAIYVISKIDPKPECPVSQPAIEVGLYDELLKKTVIARTFKVGEFGPGYRLMHVGNAKTTKTTTIWAAPTGSPLIKTVSIDAIILLPPGFVNSL